MHHDRRRVRDQRCVAVLRWTFYCRLYLTIPQIVARVHFPTNTIYLKCRVHQCVAWILYFDEQFPTFVFSDTVHIYAWSFYLGIVCSNGVPGVERDNVCCVAACGECGGKGCGSRGYDLDASDCCTGKIREEDVLCSETGKAPCIIAEDGRLYCILWLC